MRRNPLASRMVSFGLITEPEADQLSEFATERGLKIPEAVRRMTGFSADRMGLRDRGRVREGLAADLVVFDPETIGDNTTRKAPDRSPTGIDTVVLNGSVVVEAGRFDTQSRAGRALRRA